LSSSAGEFYELLRWFSVIGLGEMVNYRLFFFCQIFKWAYRLFSICQHRFIFDYMAGLRLACLFSIFKFGFIVLLIEHFVSHWTQSIVYYLLNRKKI
jgi:hypothetical protein